MRFLIGLSVTIIVSLTLNYIMEKLFGPWSVVISLPLSCSIGYVMAKWARN